MDRIEVFNNFIRDTLELQNPRDAINGILRKFCEIFSFDNAVLFLMNDKGTFFYAGYFFGLPSDRVDGIRIPTKINSFFKIALEKNRVIIRDKPMNTGIFSYDFGIIEQLMPSFCIIPIRRDIEGPEGYLYDGVLVAGYGQREEEFNRPLLYDLKPILSTYLGRLIRNAIQLKELYEKSIRDPLTGIYNRALFDEMLRKEIARVKRYDVSAVLAIIDIDYFKKVNDEFGHIVGDQVLCHLTDFLTEEIRESDTLARYGGEEFVLLLPELKDAEAQITLERLRESVMAQEFYPGLKVTISIGALVITETVLDIVGSDTKVLLDCADKALYEAKKTGRNKVLFFKVG